ncbi:hypothetical protein CPT_MarsHill_205 [Staphylococcus phage MarsHill]|nr:hypothetical protein CPT_MarsHill_205 [Staphylococcus phage MarsHill]
MAGTAQFTEIINNHRARLSTILSINLKSGNNIHLNRNIEGTLRIEGECILWEEIRSGLRNSDQLIHMVCDIEEISHISYVDGYSENDREAENIPRVLKEAVDNIVNNNKA